MDSPAKLHIIIIDFSHFICVCIDRVNHLSHTYLNLPYSFLEQVKYSLPLERAAEASGGGLGPGPAERLDTRVTPPGQVEEMEEG